MKKYLKYSVLRYSPSTVAGEKINLGIVIYDEIHNIREFKYTKKFKRISNFDDEININVLKQMLQDIKDDINISLLSDENLDVENYIKYYNNDFSFDTPKMIEYDDFDKTSERLFNIYFRFEYEKKDRPDKNVDIKLIEDIIKTKSINYKKNQFLVGDFNERVRYDIVTPMHNIKVFDFDDKDLSKMINSAKVWAFNAITSRERDKLLLIYRYSDEENANPMFDSIMKIFKASNVQIYNIEDGLQIVNRDN